MATLREYIEQLQQKHDIRIKIACEVSDEMMDKIERHLQKYDVQKVNAPNKTILQSRPLDFPNMDMAEVYIIDFTCQLPVSTEMLHQELARLLNMQEGLIVVRNANVPREVEAEHDEEAEKLKKKPEKLEAKLGTDYSKDEAAEQKADELYGDKFNTSFLKELKKISDTRRKELGQKKVTDPDIPATAPEIGDSKTTNKTSPVANRGPVAMKGK
jgi:hypothetical protein